MPVLIFLQMLLLNFPRLSIERLSIFVSYQCLPKTQFFRHPYFSIFMISFLNSLSASHHSSISSRSSFVSTSQQVLAYSSLSSVRLSYTLVVAGVISAPQTLPKNFFASHSPERTLSKSDFIESANAGTSADKKWNPCI